MQLTGNDQILADGNNALTLYCVTGEYSDKVTITWYNGTDEFIVLPQVTVEAGPSYNGKTSTQQYTFTPYWYQDTDGIKCSVSNSGSGISTDSRTAVLDLLCEHLYNILYDNYRDSMRSSHHIPEM